MDRIRKLEGENIIVVTNNLEITLGVVEENRAECRRILAENDGPFVIVIDYRDVKTSFVDIIQMIRNNQSGTRADLNQRAFSIFVGEDKLINMYRDSMLQKNSGGVSVPYFSDMDQALRAARLHLSGKSSRNIS